MSFETAELTLHVIAAFGAIVWLCGLGFLMASARSRIPLAGDDLQDRLDFSEEAPGRMLRGFAELDGDATRLASRAASLLATGTAGSLGTVKILERTEEKIRFERVRPFAPGEGQLGSFRRGELRFRELSSGRTRAEYAVEVSRPAWLLWLGVAFLALGLLGLSIGFWAIGTYVVPNQNPAVRWQVFQMLQTCHFLWPPFLLGALYRRGGRWVRQTFDVLLHNLTHLDADG